MSYPQAPLSRNPREIVRLRVRVTLEALLLPMGIGMCMALLIHTHGGPIGAGFQGGLAGLALISLLAAATLWRARFQHLHVALIHRSEHEHWSVVFTETGIGTFEIRVAEGRVYVSDSGLQMLGMKHDSSVPLSMHDWRALTHPDDLQSLDLVVASCHASGADSERFVHDYRMRHAHGHYIWVAGRWAVIQRHANSAPLHIVGSIMDITPRKQAEAALAASERSFRSLFERLPVGMALTDYRTRRFLQVNQALVQSSGYTQAQLLDMTYHQLAVRGTGAVLGQQPGEREREFRRSDGGAFPALVQGVRMTNAEGREVVWTVIQDISKHKATERELTDAAQRDRLTGLANRAQFMEQLEGSVERVRARQQRLFAVLFLDFDRFKVVNDAMGHQAGDQLLVQITGRLQRGLRSSDVTTQAANGNLIARFGGDEFLVLINNLDRPADAARIADRLLAILSDPYEIQGREVHSSASVGIVTSDLCLEGAETIIRNADLAMYEAKRAGRACSVVFNDAMHTRLSRHLLIETGLRKALECNQLSLVYQPIVELDTGKRSSVEALVRWTHPEMGVISPAEFVPIAEESGLIVPIDEWVMREGLAALARWQAMDPEKAPRVVSVNVSRAELAQGARLLRNVRASLAAAGLPAQCLQLEVTEREVMRDPTGSLALMNQLREIGVRLAMDDFGTGTSSLGCLRQYPFDVIKIDRSFIAGLEAGPDTLAVIHATITLVENLGKCSVGEGVETAEQLAILQSLGCHYAQGYFLGRPQPEEQVVETERTVIAPRLSLAGRGR